MRDIDYVKLDSKGRLDIGVFWSMAFEKIVVLMEAAFQKDRKDEARDHWTLLEILREYVYEIEAHLKKSEKQRYEKKPVSSNKKKKSAFKKKRGHSFKVVDGVKKLEDRPNDNITVC